MAKKLNLIEKLKNDSKLLLIFMSVLAAIILLFFFFWAGLVLFFFIGLVVWLVFIFAYLKVLYKINFEFRVLVYVLLLALTAILILKALY